MAANRALATSFADEAQGVDMGKFMVLTRAALVAAVLGMCANSVAAQDLSRPNILLIVGDDWGWPYYGFMIDRLRQPAAQGGLRETFCPGDFPGSPPTTCNAPCPADGAPFNASCQLDLSTPNLDRLAREGIAFENGYATESACQPAHESIYTGLNQRDLAVSGPTTPVGCSANGPQTMAEALGELGYATFVAGRYWASVHHFNDPHSTDQGKEVGERQSMSVVKDFIKRQSAVDLPGQDARPWFAMWSPLAPHGEYNGIPPHIETDYVGTEVKNPPHITTVFSSPATSRDNFEAITYFDERVGELVEFLELLEARSCDLGPDHPATEPPLTVHDSADTRNPLTNNPVTPANHRIRKHPPCQAAPGQPCPPPITCGNQPTACDPDPYYEPYIPPRDSSGPFPVPPGAHDKKCFDSPVSIVANRYAGFRRNTLILYVMDNGAGIQQSKAAFSENGLRTPIIANYPNRIPPTGLHPALVGSIDLFPTVLAYAAEGEDERPFPDAMSFRELAENPAATYPENWRRYFFSNSTPNTGTLSVVDSVPATFGSLQLRFKLYGSGNVNTASYLKRISDLTRNPFEEFEVAKPPQYTNLQSGPKYGGTVPVVTHLKTVLDVWDNHCLSECERCAVIAQLADVECGQSPANCGCPAPVTMPCRCLGPDCMEP